MVEERPWICGCLGVVVRGKMYLAASSPSVGLVDLMSVLGQDSTNVVMKRGTGSYIYWGVSCS
jgi:hypothetical protein